MALSSSGSRGIDPTRVGKVSPTPASGSEMGSTGESLPYPRPRDLVPLLPGIFPVVPLLWQLGSRGYPRSQFMGSKHDRAAHLWG